MTRRTGLLGVACLLLIRGLDAQPVTYDQRQEGRVNVQVDVKDLQIVAFVGSDMLDDLSYDYAYDYADFTVKPGSRPSSAKPTTARPLTTAVLAETSSSSASPSSSTALDSPTTKTPEESTVTSSTLSPAAKAPEETNVDDTTPSSIAKAPEETTIANGSLSPATNSTPAEMKIANGSKDDQLRAESTTSASTSDAQIPSKRPALPLGTAEPRKRCPVGFQMRSGRCFKRRHSLLSPGLALMKLAPALLSKSQLFGGHSTTKGSSS